jgi:tetratricopeptide (TPR) repeat protein
VIADVFAMQSEVAENAVKAMGVALLPHEQTKLNEISTNDLQAYDLYLRGKEARRGWGRRALERREQLYQAAIDRDPRFAQALANLASTYLAMYWEYFDRSPERLGRAKELAERAVELRPDLAEPHNALGLYFYWGLLDYRRALKEFDAALTIQPNNSIAITNIGTVLRRQGRWLEAAETFRRALEFDPQNAVLFWNLGGTLQYARSYSEADRALGLAIVLGRQWPELCANRAWLQLSWHGDVGKAEAALNGGADLTDDLGHIAEQRLQVLLARRDYQGALQQLKAEKRGAFDLQNAYLPIPLLRGQVYRLAGQLDSARRSFEAACLDLEQSLRQDPDDPRFHSSLGIAYAGLGRGDDAVQEARLGCALMPASKDALRAQDRVEDLALVYTMVGKPSDAITQLDDLLARSGWWTPHVLRLDPRWNPLRSDPRFQALLSKYEVKE